VLLAAGLWAGGRWSRQAVSVFLSGRLRTSSQADRPEVEIWFPQPRILVNAQGHCYRRDPNGRLKPLEEDSGTCVVEFVGGNLRVKLDLV